MNIYRKIGKILAILVVIILAIIVVLFIAASKGGDTGVNQGLTTTSTP